MVCTGICIRHRAQRPADPFSRYATEQKRCQMYSVYIRWDVLWCPCCGFRVRTRPRNSKFKQMKNNVIYSFTEKMILMLTVVSYL